MLVCLLALVAACLFAGVVWWVIDGVADELRE